ncbi:hypothetical protein OROMI_019635 [Orobanche minor]
MKMADITEGDTCAAAAQSPLRSEDLLQGVEDLINWCEGRVDSSSGSPGAKSRPAQEETSVEFHEEIVYEAVHSRINPVEVEELFNKAEMAKAAGGERLPMLDKETEMPSYWELHRKSGEAYVEFTDLMENLAGLAPEIDFQ